MSVLSSLARRLTDLSDREVDHLHRLLADWQLLADLNFADLLLFARVKGEGGYLILSQVRPYPAQTLYQEDMVGVVLESRPRVAEAFALGRIVREGEPEWREGTPVREETFPVQFEGRVIAVISSEQNLATARTPSTLELSYLRAAAELAQMICDGDFPFPGEDTEREMSPRVGDGFLVMGTDMVVTYASPNAVSAYRRLGATANLIGSTPALSEGDKGVIDALRAGQPVFNEVESNGAWVMRRFLPIVHKGSVEGALGFLRDVTELRHRDRMLLAKEATIREIHHRVKNNLQTVASLLRMQSRRVGSIEAKAALGESIRRISSIAVVHETLAHESEEKVEFDGVAQRVLDMVAEGLMAPDRPVSFVLQGTGRSVPSEIATPLALILNELCQNAVEHAFERPGGTVRVTLERTKGRLRMEVADDGVGLPEGFTLEQSQSLGLQIVRTLVKSELNGEIEIASEAGTRITIDIPVAGQ